MLWAKSTKSNGKSTNVVFAFARLRYSHAAAFAVDINYNTKTSST